MEPPPVRSPSKFPLITPSASPPPKVLPARMSDSAPPYKRQRTFSTPRRDIASSSRTQTPIDMDKQREASKMRLLDVWSSLAARYTRSIDEDDIVDLRTLKVSTDNGVLRNASKVTFGSIPVTSTTPEGDNLSQDGDDEVEEDDVYGVDELDAFAESPANERIFELGNASQDAQGVHDDNAEPMLPKLPTMPPLGPMCDDDLREFLEAERQRKEICGTDGEDDEDYDGTLEFNEDEGSGSESGLPEEPDKDEEEVSHEPEEDNEEEPEEDEEKELSGDQLTVGVIDDIGSLTVTSEDELDNWTVDESSAVHIIMPKEESTKNEATIEDDSDIEFIDTPVRKKETTPACKKHVQSPRKKLREIRMPPSSPQTSLKTAHQLHTPPLSQSSSRPSETPVRGKLPSLDANTSHGRAESARERSNAPKYQQDIPTKEVMSTPPVELSGLPKSPVKRKERKTSVSPQKPEALNRSPSKHSRRATPIVLLTPRRGSSQKLSTSLFDDDDSSIIDKAETDDGHKDMKGKGKAKAMIGSPRKTKEINVRPEEDVGKLQSVSKVQARGQRQTVSSVDIDDQDSPAGSSSSRQTFTVVPNSEEPADPFVTRASRPRKSSARKTPSKNDISFPISRSISPTPSTSSRLTRKRKRQYSDVSSVQSNEPIQQKKPEKVNNPIQTYSSNHASVSHRYIDEATEVPKIKPSSSRRKQRVLDSPSESSSDSDASEVNESYRRHRSQSRQPYPEEVYTHPYHLPQGYPHMPDPRAQILISQTMQQLSQQLSALVGASWGPPPHYMDGAGPRTPSHKKHRGQHLAGPFITPNHHPHPYPYAYDPNLSLATVPPDSPDPDSSPVKKSSGRRNTLVHRSHSRGRRVSFKLEQDYQSSEENEDRSSPSRMRPLKFGPPKSGKKKSPDKGKQRQASKSRKSDTESEESESGVELKPREYKRGQTPGPNIEHGQSNSAKLKHRDR